MRTEIGLVAPSELPERLLVSQVDVLPGEFHVVHAETLRQSKEMTEFWERRTHRLLREARERSSPGAYHALVRHYLRSQQAEQARVMLEEATSRGLSSPALKAAHVQILCRVEPLRVESYLKELTASYNLNPDDPEFIVDVSRALLLSGDKRNARNFLERLNAVPEDDASALAAASELWWIIRDEGSAWRLAERSTLIDANQVRAWNVMASVSVHQAEYSRALDYFSRALSVDPLFRPALINIIVLKMNYLGEVADFNRARDYVQAYGTDVQFAYRIAVLAWKSGEQALVKWIWDSLREHSACEDGTLRIGLMITSAGALGGERESAISFESLVMRLDSRTPNAAVDAAVWISKESRFHKLLPLIVSLRDKCNSIQWLSEALSGLLAYAARGAHAALPSMERAFRSNAASDMLTRLLANLYLDSGSHYREAAELAGKTLDSDMSGLGEWNNAIYADLMNNNVARARDRWDRVSRRPAWSIVVQNNHYVRATYGLLLMRSGLCDEGLVEYVEAEKIAKSDSEKARVIQKGKLEMGREMKRVGRVAFARPYLEAAAVGPDSLFATEARELMK